MDMVCPVARVTDLRRSTRLKRPGTISGRRPVVKISARNRLKGRVVEVRKGQTTAHVRLDVYGIIITAAITNEAVDELGLREGQDAYAVVKASDVMIALDA